MNARDELADLLTGHPVTLGPKPFPLMKGFAQEIAEKVLAAGYTKPRTIETAEELDALPDGSVVINAKGRPFELDTVRFPSESPLRVYSVPGVAEDWPTDRITLPATVLYEPRLS